MARRDGVLEQQRVADDRHRHARGLRPRLLIERFAKPNRQVDATISRVAFHRRGRRPHAEFENRHALLDQARGRQGMLHATGDVVQAAAQPPFGRPAARPRWLPRQYAIAELAARHARRQIRLPAAQFRRQTNRHHLFDPLAIDRRQAQARRGVPFHGCGRRELGFHDNGLHALRARHDVRPQRAVLREDAALLGVHGLPPQRMLVAQRLGERGVDSGFAVLRHGLALRFSAGRRRAPPLLTP